MALTRMTMHDYHTAVHVMPLASIHRWLLAAHVRRFEDEAQKALDEMRDRVG